MFSRHYGAYHYGASQYDASAMAHARLAQVQYDAGPVWRISLWRRTSMTHFTMAHSTIAQVQYGAFPYSAVLAGVALFQCVAVSPSCQYDTCILFR